MEIPIFRHEPVNETLLLQYTARTHTNMRAATYCIHTHKSCADLFARSLRCNGTVNMYCIDENDSFNHSYSKTSDWIFSLQLNCVKADKTNWIVLNFNFIKPFFILSELLLAGSVNCMPYCTDLGLTRVLIAALIIGAKVHLLFTTSTGNVTCAFAIVVLKMIRIKSILSVKEKNILTNSSPIIS